jgi:hypothetical protein
MNSLSMCTSCEDGGRNHSPVQQWAQNIESSDESQERRVPKSAHDGTRRVRISARNFLIFAEGVGKLRARVALVEPELFRQRVRRRCIPKVVVPDWYGQNVRLVSVITNYSVSPFF